MALRIHELHPTLVHFPLALVPLALITDLVGVITGNRSLMRAGARLMPVAAASGAVAGAAGLVAQAAVNTEGEAHDILVTHRNLNLGLVALTAVLAAVRGRTEKPGIGYLAAGLAGVAAMNYTAYLGGKLVYHHGVGVEKAGGVNLDKSPELTWRRAGAALSTAAEGREAAMHAAEHVKEGEIAPALTHGA